MLKKMIRFLLPFILILLSACVDSSDNSDNEILVIRERRKAFMADLLKQNINFYQQGQTLTFIVPMKKLFKSGTTVPLYKSSQLYQDIVKVINSYRVENVKLEAHIVGSTGKMAKDYARAQAQTVEDNLLANGLKVPVILSKGYTHSGYIGNFGVQEKEFLKIQFRFLRILV